MADLMAKQTNQVKGIQRGEIIEGTVVALIGGEIIVDLGTKSEGVFQKKDLSPDQAKSIKVGDKITATVIHPENQSGQVVTVLIAYNAGGGRIAGANTLANLPKETQNYITRAIPFYQSLLGGIGAAAPSTAVGQDCIAAGE